MQLPVMIVSASWPIRMFNTSRIAIWNTTRAYGRAAVVSLFSVVADFFGNSTPFRISALIFRIYMCAVLQSGLGLPALTTLLSGIRVFYGWADRRIAVAPRSGPDCVICRYCSANVSRCV